MLYIFAGKLFPDKRTKQIKPISQQSFIILCICLSRVNTSIPANCKRSLKPFQMKKNLFSHFAIILSMILMLSCTKEKQNGFYDEYKASVVKAENVVTSSLPTRKAIEYSYYDYDEDVYIEWYDCTQPGSSCDVGETPPDPEALKANGSKTTALNDLRSVAIREIQTLSKKKQINYLLNRSSLFPIINNNEIYQKIKDNNYSLSIGKNYIAIEDVASKTPVFVYKTNVSTSVKLNTLPPDSTNDRKAKKNTDDGTIDCKDAGSNCSTLAASVYDDPSDITLKFSSILGLEIKSLFEKMSKKEYVLFKGKNYYELKNSNTGKSNFIVF